MNKKYNETMVVENGKMIYAISLKEKSKSGNNFIMIKNGEIYFTGKDGIIQEVLILIMKLIE